PMEGSRNICPVVRTDSAYAQIEIAEMIKRIGRSLLEAIARRVVERRIRRRAQLCDGTGVLQQVNADRRRSQRDLAAIEHRPRRQHARPSRRRRLCGSGNSQCQDKQRKTCVGNAHRCTSIKVVEPLGCLRSPEEWHNGPDSMYTIKYYFS